MMKKVTLLFAALMITLGVSAQEGTTVEERGAAKGYYPFAAKVTEMEQITSLDQLTDGMEIMIKHSHEGTDQDDHEGSYLTINSLSTGGEGGYHNVFMHSIPTGVGVWTTDAVGDGSYQLKSAHMTIVDGAKCYLGYPRYDSNLYDDVITTLKNDNFSQCTYKFETTGDGRWALKYTYVTRNYIGTVISQSTGYLCVTSTSGKIKIVSSSTLNANCYFNVYQVKEKSAAQIKYVETTVKLTGAAGNIFTTDHAGWNDFYEFSTESYDSYSNYKVLNNHGVILSNIYYHEESNEITGGIRFPFSVSGKIAKIPVHLCSYGDTLKRFAVGENNTVKVITRPDNPTEGDGWFKNQENQWYIYPQFDEEDHMVYSIQNVATGQYLYSELNSDDLKLSETPTYFKLYQTAPSGNVRFSRPRTGPYSTYLSFLCESSSKGHTTTTAGTNVNFAVPRVSGEEAGGYDAIGFTRTYHSDTYFWDGGEIAMDDAPADLKAVFEDENHEGYDTEDSEHRIYTANTGIYVPKMGDVTVTFNYLGGTDRLTILGVDIVDALGDIVSSEYHLGYAGVDVDDNVYVVKDVPVGNYFLRYWVCNRTDWENEKNHNLSNNSGQIRVEGADYYLTYSDTPTNGAFSSNSTWYRMRLSDGLEKYISAQPNYVDAANNLMVTNDTPPNDYAGLWTIVGDEENGYKFYNRAWGPEYAMKTVGENGEARTYMVPVAEASTYDIVQRDRSTKDYKFYVKLHGTDNNYLQNFGGYNGTGHLSTWNNSGALGDAASVMTFETLNMEVFEANTTIVKNNLIANWNPWVGNPKVSDFVKSISNSFAQLMLKRNDFSILDGKVFMFVNKGPVDDGRQGRVLRVDANNNMAGVVSQGDLVDDFLQIVDNGDGTFKLLHLATNKYFQKPNVHTITENAADAAAYSYKVYGDEVQALCFISSNEMMHLGNWGYDYTTTHYNEIAAGASRWDVIYNADAQDLADLIAQAKVRYAATQETAYQANVGVPGYANADSTTALLNTFNGGLVGMTFAKATTALTDAMNGVTEAEKAVFFPTNCYFTITNRNQSVIFDENYTSENCNDDYLWCTTSVEADNLNHLWGFYYDEVTEEYYLYNVGKVLFANSKGKGEYGDTWIFSSAPVAITMEAMDTPYFHIKGDGKTMSVSTGYVGPVITYYADGDQGVPMQFNKSTVPFDESLLDKLEALSRMQLKPGFYTLSCGDNLYLNDDVVVSDNMRSLTALTSDKIKNIFYLTEDQELVGYASGYGFTYANCNTGKPEEGYNTFTFSKAAEDGKYLVKAEDGKSVYGWADRYLTAVDGKLVVNEGVKKNATAWTIEAVTELPVTLNYAGEGLGAYGTLWSPVALNIPDGIKAFYGSVSEDNALVLTEVEGGVIPAEAGVVLWDENATTTYVKSLGINADATVEAPETNKFEGWVFTRVNENKGYYYSLGKMNDHMAFYKYTGANLSGFRARIARQNAQGIQSLSFRFANPTSIEEVISGFQNNAVYDLNGRRVTTPEKGIYIVNGKKVIIK